MIVSERVRRLAEGLFEYEDLGERELKGVNAPTHVYRVMGVTEAESRFDAAAQRGLTPLVGRDNEVGTLLDAWKACGKAAADGSWLCVAKRASARAGSSTFCASVSGRRRAGPRYFRAPLFLSTARLFDEDLVRANAGPQSRGGPRRAPRQARSADGRQAGFPQDDLRRVRAAGWRRASARTRRTSSGKWNGLVR